MAVEPKNYVTKEEVENSYEFKLMKRIIKKEFPFVKDIILPNDDEINKWELIFVILVIDPFQLQRMTGWEISSFVKSYFNLLAGYYQDYRFKSVYPQTMFNISRDEGMALAQEIERTMRSISTSPALPQDLKIGKDRLFAIGEWAIPKNIPIPDDAVFAKPSK